MNSNMSGFLRITPLCVIAGAKLLMFGGSASGSELLISSYNQVGAVSQVLRYEASGNTYPLQPIPAYDAGVAAGVFIGPTVPGGNGGLNKPYGLLLGTDGNVYVASNGTNSVKVYDGTTGHYIKDFVTAGSGGLNGPWGMCWGPDGSLYVASNGSNQILRYQGPDGYNPGAFMNVFTSGGGLSAPRGVVFGNDQWAGPGQPAGPAQDGYPDLYVCSTGSTSGQILRYHGLTGAFVDVFADVKTYAGGALPVGMVYEQFFRRNDPRYNEIFTGNVLIATTNNIDLQIHQGSSSDAESVILGVPNHGFYGGFPNSAMIYVAAPVWGPNHSTDGERRQSLYLPDNWGSQIRLVGANEAKINNNAGVITGVPRPQGLLVKCGRNPGTLIRKVLQNRMQLGTSATLRLQGDNMAGLLASSGGGVSIRKMRSAGGGIGVDGTITITGQNTRLDGNDLLVDFDLSGANVEAGRYWVRPNDACRNAMWFPEAVLVYLPQLTNPSFEVPYEADARENNNFCVNNSEWDANGGGNKKRPIHWDLTWGGPGMDPDGGGYGSDQFSFRRDGNVWGPSCMDSTVEGMTGQHFASIQMNFSLSDYYAGTYQTIAAPHLSGQTSTKDYDVYVDAHIAAFGTSSYGRIRLRDGDNFNGAVIAETIIPNTQVYGDQIVRSPEFRATVPAGYIYTSNPAILTIEFDFVYSVADNGPGMNLAAFHLDNVRNRYIDCGRSRWADSDDDGDVDMDDFGAFQVCYSGQTGTAADTCGCFDRNQDGRVEDIDWVAFQNCALGPTVPVLAPECQ